ncbi:arsenic resistance protein [Brevibacterium paucivorans]|uniref:arsenic resistance protein n=1 Tax=Brevibacterium paucivorans TaxID=170994 RepID=UPI003219B364
MNPVSTPSTPSASETPKLSTLDRLLPVFILCAMGVGVALSVWVPQSSDFLNRFKISDISLPIALGLLVMMYPPLAKVRFDKARDIARDRRLMVLSLLLNWVAGPLLMFVCAT